VAGGIVFALAVGVWCAPAEAEEEGAKTIAVRVQEYVRGLTTLRKSEDVYRIHEEVWQAPDLYDEAAADGSGALLQARLVKGIGMLSRHKDERVRQAAIEALGVMRHEDGAAYLKPLLKNYKEKPAKPLTLAAIDAAGGVAHESLVIPLLKFVDACPCPIGLRHAVEALGHYGAVKGKRETILIELLETTLEEEELDRWKVLAKSVPGALNRLTGRKVETLDGWLELIDANRGDLSVLFPKEEEPVAGG